MSNALRMAFIVPAAVGAGLLMFPASPDWPVPHLAQALGVGLTAFFALVALAPWRRS